MVGPNSEGYEGDAEYFPTGLQMAMVLSRNIQSSAQG